MERICKKVEIIDCARMMVLDFAFWEAVGSVLEDRLL